jgi:rare lipoprotein A
MTALNNKRYLIRIMVCGLFLCVCLAACAQGMETSESTAEKMGDVPTAIAPAEDMKAEEVKNDAPKTEGIVGLASFYAAKFNGKRTANGERFNPKLMTAAHLTLPFGTQLKVTNLRNMKSVIVRVNDRGPHVRGRIVDVSRAAAELIGMRHSGTARVELEILKPEQSHPPQW